MDMTARPCGLLSKIGLEPIRRGLVARLDVLELLEVTAP